MQTRRKTKTINRLTNYMEVITETVLGGLLAKERKGFSKGAIRDIKALALNRLWPMYTTSVSGQDFLKKIIEEDKIEKDVVRELKAAIDIVRTNPR